MGRIERITLDLPSPVASALRARVATGRFASESEAVIDALAATDNDARGVDAWLRGPVADAFDAVDDGSATLIPLEYVRQRFRPRG